MVDSNSLLHDGVFDFNLFKTIDSLPLTWQVFTKTGNHLGYFWVVVIINLSKSYKNHLQKDDENKKNMKGAEGFIDGVYLGWGVIMSFRSFFVSVLQQEI